MAARDDLASARVLPLSKCDGAAAAAATGGGGSFD